MTQFTVVVVPPIRTPGPPVSRSSRPFAVVGQLGPEDEASSDGGWAAIRDLPVLARYLPEVTPPLPKPGDVVTLHGLNLRLGADGKPLPPDPATIAQLLSADAPGGQLADTAKQVRSVINVVLGLLVLLGFVLLWKVAPAFWRAL